MLSQSKSAVREQPAKLSWQIISGAPPLFSGPLLFFESYWPAGFERFRQPPALSLIGWEDLQAVRQLS
jgi:hypothetical protein